MGGSVSTDTVGGWERGNVYSGSLDLWWVMRRELGGMFEKGRTWYVAWKIILRRLFLGVLIYGRMIPLQFAIYSPRWRATPLRASALCSLIRMASSYFSLSAISLSFG